jgi:cysteine synthase
VPPTPDPAPALPPRLHHDAFVHCVGTAASSRGVATVLKRYKPSIKIVAVEPADPRCY